MAEARKNYMKHIHKYAFDLRLIGDKALNDLLRQTGLPLGLRTTYKDDKILNLIQYERGFRGPVISIKDIMSRAYAEPNAADRLNVYQTFVIYRVLQNRKIKS